MCEFICIDIKRILYTCTLNQKNIFYFNYQTCVNCGPKILKASTCLEIEYCIPETVSFLTSVALHVHTL